MRFYCHTHKNWRVGEGEGLLYKIISQENHCKTDKKSGFFLMGGASMHMRLYAQGCVRYQFLCIWGS